MHRLGVLLTLAHLYCAKSWTALEQRAAGRGSDRGNALVTAVITVGLVMIAVVVIAIVRAKATEVANNICTAADPTTCQQ
ncbi:hypothetical protein [Parafrankia sp. EUN1f]|uniref:hypothetical protein n=1 Tax=Parafrankia sp. EUN1f TaxID=102897 RepID=UPI000681EB43|nr:hypothetical protein [Parafrankia sp. EUN1f]